MKKLILSAVALLAISFQTQDLKATTIDFSLSAKQINGNVGFGPYRQPDWNFSLEARTKIDSADSQANPLVAGLAGTIFMGDLGNLGVAQQEFFCVGIQSNEVVNKDDDDEEDEDDDDGNGSSRKNGGPLSVSSKAQNPASPGSDDDDEDEDEDSGDRGFAGSRGISGSGKHQDEALIVNFDQPQPVDGIKLGLCGIDDGDQASLTLIFDNGNRQTFASVQNYVTPDANGFATLDLSTLPAPVGPTVNRLALRCLSGHSGVASLTTALFTGIDNQSETLPLNFELGANYPNPFNPTTQIPYSLKAKGHVRIDVYNLLGEHVRTLIDRTQSAGAHTVEWNGTASEGSTMSSGIYFYRLRTNTFSVAHKMLLLK